MIDGKLTYYMDPIIEGAVPWFMRITAFQGLGGLFYPSMTSKLLDNMRGYEKALYMPNIVASPRPSDMPFAPAGVLYVLDQFSDPSNWAHLLLDTIAS
jgi:hypothetical protein